MIRRRSTIPRSGWVKFEPPLGWVVPAQQRAWFLGLCVLAGLMFAVACAVFRAGPGLIPLAAYLSGGCFALVAWRLWRSM